MDQIIATAQVGQVARVAVKDAQGCWMLISSRAAHGDVVTAKRFRTRKLLLAALGAPVITARAQGWV